MRLLDWRYWILLIVMWYRGRIDGSRRSFWNGWVSQLFYVVRTIRPRGCERLRVRNELMTRDRLQPRCDPTISNPNSSGPLIVKASRETAVETTYLSLTWPIFPF